MFDEVNFLRIVADGAEVAEKGTGGNGHVFGAVGNLFAEFDDPRMVFGRDVRLLNVEFVGNFIKFVDDFIQIFNQMQHVGTQVGNQILDIKFVVAAQGVGVMFNGFYLFAQLAIVLAAFLVQKYADGLFERHGRVNDFIVKQVNFVFKRFGACKQRYLYMEHIRFLNLNFLKYHTS